MSAQPRQFDLRGVEQKFTIYSKEIPFHFVTLKIAVDKLAMPFATAFSYVNRRGEIKGSKIV
jgi:hypothetical protein